MGARSVFKADRGRPITKPSKRATDRAPHMGQYVRAGRQYGTHGVHIVIGNQGFFIPTGNEDEDGGSPTQRATWSRDMLCIALDNLVGIEIERRKQRRKATR
jgi:hypothetical protein